MATPAWMNDPIRSTHNAVGAGTEAEVQRGDFNLGLDFTTGAAVGAQMQLQRKSLGGSSFVPVTYIDGSALGPFTADMHTTFSDGARGTVYRWYCLAITSGSVTSLLAQ
jgi:hypothetical protein